VGRVGFASAAEELTQSSTSSAVKAVSWGADGVNPIEFLVLVGDATVSGLDHIMAGWRGVQPVEISLVSVRSAALSSWQCPRRSWSAYLFSSYHRKGESSIRMANR
jgi:hypothetical protein